MVESRDFDNYRRDKPIKEKKIFFCSSCFAALLFCLWHTVSHARDVPPLFKAAHIKNLDQGLTFLSLPEYIKRG